MHRPAKDVGKSLRLTNLEVLINAVLYNPNAALHFIGASQGLFFESWFGAISGLKRVHDKKLTILALAGLLESGNATGGIVAGAIEAFKGLPEAIEKRKELQEWAAEEEEEDDEDEEGGLEMRGDDEDVWDEDNAYLEMLAREGERIRANHRAEGTVPVGITGEEEDSDDEDDESLDEELTYLSPIDNVNPYVTFKRALTGTLWYNLPACAKVLTHGLVAFQMSNPSGYSSGTTSLTAEQSTLLMEIMKKAEESDGTA